jgi:CelD/BcsL family acetyltransferase involved in cellulose biosynthesis
MAAPGRMNVTPATPLTAFRSAGVAADAATAAPLRRVDSSGKLPSNLQLRIHDTLADVEDEWRRFERVADCSAFQTFDWLAAWQRHVGRRDGTVPVIAVGAFGNGETAFILPLAIERTRVGKRLCWLGQELCDYNAPLLAPDFAQHVTREAFVAAWRELQRRMQRDPRLRHDWIELEKMPQTVGDQLNPFTWLAVTPNASGAHLTRLGTDWEKFYVDKRSSATRRRDRIKRTRMAAFGDIRFATAVGGEDSRHTLNVLMDQKRRALAHRGIPDMFARPGYREFFLQLVSDAKTRDLVHVSRIEIGSTLAAANLGLVFGDCYYHVLASYADDTEASRYGPGVLHLRELMAYAIGRGLRRFDFTIGDERYKLEWSDTDVALWDLTAAATWRGVPAMLWSRARRRLKRFIKQTPPIWRAVSNMRSAVGFLHK